MAASTGLLVGSISGPSSAKVPRQQRWPAVTDPGLGGMLTRAWYRRSRWWIGRHCVGHATRGSHLPFAGVVDNAWQHEWSTRRCWCPRWSGPSRPWPLSSCAVQAAAECCARSGTPAGAPCADWAPNDSPSPRGGPAALTAGPVTCCWAASAGRSALPRGCLTSDHSASVQLILASERSAPRIGLAVMLAVQASMRSDAVDGIRTTRNRGTVVGRSRLGETRQVNW